MSKIISGAEIRGAVIEGSASVRGYGTGAAEHWQAEYKAIAKAQRDSSDREWIELLEGFRYEGEAPNDVGVSFNMPSNIWQALKQKVTGER